MQEKPMNTRTFDEKIVQRYSWKDENSIGHGDWLAKSSLATSAFETVKKEFKKKKNEGRLWSRDAQVFYID